MTARADSIPAYPSLSRFFKYQTLHIALTVAHLLPDFYRDEDIVAVPVPEGGMAYAEFLHHLLLGEQDLLCRADHSRKQLRLCGLDCLSNQLNEVFKFDIKRNAGHATVD